MTVWKGDKIKTKQLILLVTYPGQKVAYLQSSLPSLGAPGLSGLSNTCQTMLCHAKACVYAFLKISALVSMA